MVSSHLIGGLIIKFNEAVSFQISCPKTKWAIITGKNFGKVVRSRQTAMQLVSRQVWIIFARCTYRGSRSPERP
jgi:hypothetical protein